MMAADGGFEQVQFVDDSDDAAGDDSKFAMDLESFLSVLDEDCDASESSPEDSSLKYVSPGESGVSPRESGVDDNCQVHNGSQAFEEPLFPLIDFSGPVVGCSDGSDFGTRGSIGVSDSAGKFVLDSEHRGLQLQTCSSQGDCAGGYQDSFSVAESNEVCDSERTGVSKLEMPSFNMDTGFPESNSSNIADFGDNLNLWKGGDVIQIKHAVYDVEPEYASHSPMFEDIDVDFEDYGSLLREIIGVSGQQENDSCTSFEMSPVDADRSMNAATSTDPTTCQGSYVPSDVADYYLSMNCYQGTDGKPIGNTFGCLPNAVSPQLWTNEGMKRKMKVANFGDTAHASSGIADGISLQNNQFMSAEREYPLNFPGNVLFESKTSMQTSTRGSYISSEGRPRYVKAERDELITPYHNSSQGDDTEFSVGQEVKQITGTYPSVGCQGFEFFKHGDNDTVVKTERANCNQDPIDGKAYQFPANMGKLNLKSFNKCLSTAQALTGNEKQFTCVASQEAGKIIQHKSITQISRGNVERSHLKDSDVCIIENISHPAPISRSAEVRTSLNMSQSLRSSYSQPQMVGGSRPKARDEQYILRVALQDLSQPKSEVIPPDGLLAVPLLRHQRIALSWMVQKETSSLYCSGGILADDQGLGKTVSTIALILKERAPMLNQCNSAQKSELETLNLDADDDLLLEDGRVMKDYDGDVNKESNGCQDMSCRSPIKSMSLSVHMKGRPSAGTLIVCPTSVLRQWADELHNKVTCKANLSVLVYHGSNRTKDPYELAKYDVVLTTYSIVSMEVPKQPLVDKDDDEKGIFDNNTVPSKKRKCPASSNRGDKKGLDRTMLEAAARPLAKVAWFRVVLDEAQSIKNHRTQVARACWGLRAKRRWCLSGTPIQNAIDDLYSYFRFLRYDPYAVYTSFCSTIKIPISRNPSKGYRKLQAVLKTVMLRRTKGTLLDGQPIISLPPKYVELKKVDFSQEERDFYSRLEADSRAQFQEYADAGTVKQNYVNILLMLLRLRQACDHPLLVKRYNSNSLWKSSVEMAQKLPQEQQIALLKCLEASLALCRICNDPPEDAVVSVCGHVFCNQCICEHLTGDDNQCPASKCKSRLSMTSVFSKATLNSSLSGQAYDNLSGCSGSEIGELEPCFQTQSFDSSKIKAALEVLCSLSKPHNSETNSVQNTFGESTGCLGNSPGADNGKSLSAEVQNMSAEKSSNVSVNVVGEKAIVFSQWTRMLDLLEVSLKNSSIQYRRLDGTMSVIARDKAVKDFNTLPEVSVMIMSLKAASLGLNMVAACHVLMLDLWWNPTTEDQAIDRAHRIGQTRPVTVLRLTVRDTVEDRILALQQKKRKMVASAFGEDGTGGRQTRLTVDDLKYLFMI